MTFARRMLWFALLSVTVFLIATADGQTYVARDGPTSRHVPLDQKTAIADLTALRRNGDDKTALALVNDVLTWDHVDRDLLAIWYSLRADICTELEDYVCVAESLEEQFALEDDAPNDWRLREFAELVQLYRSLSDRSGERRVKRIWERRGGDPILLAEAAEGRFPKRIYVYDHATSPSRPYWEVPNLALRRLTVSIQSTGPHAQYDGMSCLVTFSVSLRGKAENISSDCEHDERHMLASALLLDLEFPPKIFRGKAHSQKNVVYLLDFKTSERE